MKSFKESPFLKETLKYKTLEFVEWVNQQERLFHFNKNEIIDEIIKNLKKEKI